MEQATEVQEDGSLKFKTVKRGSDGIGYLKVFTPIVASALGIKVFHGHQSPRSNAKNAYIYFKCEHSDKQNITVKTATENFVLNDKVEFYVTLNCHRCCKLIFADESIFIIN